jgi:RHS repeat-associated protein
VRSANHQPATGKASAPPKARVRTRAAVYCFAFNGKEKDDEVYGSTGTSLDFGARLYDPRVGRWLCEDPLSPKYPQWTPYSFTFDNPIAYFDSDGREGVAVVDKEKKTITIKAVYHVQTEPLPGRNDLRNTDEEVKAMQETTNDFLNHPQYKVTEGEYKDYAVIFDLAFVPSGPSYMLDPMAEKSTLDGFPIGNTIRLGDENSHPQLFHWKRDMRGNRISIQGGVTSNHRDIVLHREYGGFMVMIHEIFHSLFFDQDESGSGIGGGLIEGVHPPNPEDINRLINNPQLPKITKE